MSLTGGVVGFDFGTDKCVISQAKRGGIDTVLNESAKRFNPCLVSFQGKERFLGEQAFPLSKSNYKNTVRSFKRLLGRAYKDPVAQREISLMPNVENFIELADGSVGVKVVFNDEEQIYTMEQITAMMLNKLRKIVRGSKSHDLATDVVISIPGYWNEKQRRAMLDACEIAGFSALRLLSDHAAVALSYGIFKSARNEFSEQPVYVMFVDIGYANTSVAVVSFVQGKLEVVSAAFDENLGGRDLDVIIVDKFAKEFKAKHKLDVYSNPKSLLKLRDAAEKAKQTLTPFGVDLAKIQVEYLMEEIDFKSELSLDELEKLSADFISKVKTVIDRAMTDSKLTYEQVNTVEIIGGGSRPKIVKKAIAEAMKLDLEKPNHGLSTTLNLDESVARGCALNSAMLSPQFRVKEFDVYDTVNFPIKLTWEQTEPTSTASGEENDGVDAGAGANSVAILNKNATTPATKRITFRRNKPFEVCAAYDESCAAEFPPNFNLNLSKFKVLTPTPVGSEEESPRIRVDFKHDKNGLFTLSSAEMLKEVKPKVEEKKDEEKKDSESKEEKKEEKPEAAKSPKKQYQKLPLKVEKTFTYGLSAEVVKQHALKEKQMCDVDRELEETAEAKNALESYIYTTRTKLDGELRVHVIDSEKNEFMKQLEVQENWLYDDGFDVAKLEYQKRLSQLKDFGDRIEERYSETTDRPAAQREFQEAVNQILTVINSTEESYDHINEDERARVRKKIDEVNEWLSLQNQGQEKLALTDDPVLTGKMIREQLQSLMLVATPVVTKRRPLPKKEEKPEAKMEEDTKANTESKEPTKDGEKKEGDPTMDVD